MLNLRSSRRIQRQRVYRYPRKENAFNGHTGQSIKPNKHLLQSVTDTDTNAENTMPAWLSAPHSWVFIISLLSPVASFARKERERKKEGDIRILEAIKSPRQ